ncbi:MAG TPA: RagB/SusD family nutrient uptake outer membrane protein [Saprospiraceae bacterium]|nr:RagB/SusD family nutrient uptake outer membrane protein [Saprospiraceae bacterium]HND87080.1 RagB/SusD family nutrient uptake outer membrane protein [Saprospiraceae bacterium]
MNLRFSISATAVMLLLCTTQCQKDFLDRTPPGELTFEEFFKTSDQAVQATNAVYEQFRSFDCVGLGYLSCTDILSDDADKGSTFNDAPLIRDLDDFTMDATNPFIAPVYKGYYRAIARANIAIENIPKVDMDATLRSRLVGECQLLRAYSYLLLVQWFGDLPLITKTLQNDEYYAQERRPRGEVYDQIEADLKAAIATLPERDAYAPADKGRASKGAARGLLAKLYMLKKDWANAETQCMDIVNSGKYSLLPKYGDNFLPIGENGAESVFEFQAVALQTQQAAGPGSSPYNMIQGVRGIPNLGWGFNRPSDALIAAYETANDPRRQATIFYELETLPDGSGQIQKNPEIINARFNQKAWVPAHPGLQDNGPGNIRILRYADVLLLAAEAKNELGKSAEALPLINQVRARARGGNPFILKDLLVNDQFQLRELIYKERRVELAMEQHRWFDLLRWGRAEQEMKAAGKTNFKTGKHELLPIPQTEVDLTGGKIKQNKEY